MNHETTNSQGSPAGGRGVLVGRHSAAPVAVVAHGDRFPHKALASMAAPQA